MKSQDSFKDIYLKCKALQDYALIDDFWYTLVVIRTLGHILRQILVAKIPISHGGNRTPELPILSPTL